MFNPHHHQQQQQQQQQFHQHLRQLQQLFQQQTPPPPPPPPPPQPPPTHHMPHHHGAGRPMAAPAPPSARMVNLCSATQTIIAPNPMLQGALLMQQMQGGMRSFAMGGQQFQQFFATGSRASILGPVPLGVAIKTPHMGFPPRHFNPRSRYFNNDYQSRQPDRKRGNEYRPAIGHDSQSGASSSRDETPAVADVSGQSSTQQPDEPTAKKQRTEGVNNSLQTEASPSAEYEHAAEDPETEDCIPEEDGTVAGSEAAEALEQSRAAEQVEGPESSLKNADQQSSSSQSEPAASVAVADGKDDTAHGDGAKEGGAGGETANKFYCYICNITCHNQQNFQSHMNGLAHQQRMMEIQHMSNACLVTLLPRVQESLQGPRKDGEKRPGLQRWCPTCKIHFTTNVMDHRKTREHKICGRSTSPSCTVCKQQFRTSREFIEHVQSSEHIQRMEQVLKETGKGNLEELGLEVYTVGADEEGMDSDEEERLDEENGQQEGLPVQMEVTLEDLTEEEEFDSDTVYGSNFVIPVAGFLCRLCNEFYHYEASARRSHCKTRQHFENLKRYKALKLQEASAVQDLESVCTSADHQTEDTESPSGSSVSDPPINNSTLVSTEAATVQESITTTTTTTTTTTSKESNNNNSSSSSSSSTSAPTSPNQQPPPGSPTLSRDKTEDTVTEEPEEEEDVVSEVPEEKAPRGRGRTPAKKRGRGGRRR